MLLSNSLSPTNIIHSEKDFAQGSFFAKPGVVNDKLSLYAITRRKLGFGILSVLTTLLICICWMLCWFGKLRVGENKYMFNTLKGRRDIVHLQLL